MGRAAGSATIEVIDPTTEQVIGRIPEGTPDDVDRAVSRGPGRVRGVARGARSSSASRPAPRSARRWPSGRDEIAALIAAEVGMPLALARTIQAGLPAMDFGSIGAGRRPRFPWEEQIGNSLVVREPVGVVGAITPWNYPLHQIVREGRRRRWPPAARWCSSRAR